MKWINKRTLTVLVGVIVAILILLSSNLMALPQITGSSEASADLHFYFKQVSISRIILPLLKLSL